MSQSPDTTRTTERDLLRAVFMQGAEAETRIDCKDPKTATSLRFRAYNFSRTLKKKGGDPDLMQAIAQTSLATDGQYLVARPKTAEAGMQAILEALGGPEGVAKINGQGAAAREAQESFERMQKLLEAEKVAEVTEPGTGGKTKYYTR